MVAREGVGGWLDAMGLFLAVTVHVRDPAVAAPTRRLAARRAAVVAFCWFAGCAGDGSGDEGTAGDASAQMVGGGDAPAHEGAAGSTADADDARGAGAAGMTGSDEGANGAAVDAGVDTGAGPDAGGARDAGEGAFDAATMEAADAAVPQTIFRITQLLLRDPAFYLGDTDITDEPFLGQSVNMTLIPSGMTTDYDADGYVDVSLMIALSPPMPDAVAPAVAMFDARCEADDPTICSEHPAPGLNATWTAHTQGEGVCLEPIEETTTRFPESGAELPEAPCFATEEERDVVLDLSGIRLSLTAARVAASYDGSAPDRLVRGLIRGFVTQSDAQDALLPDYLLLFAGTPLSDYLDSGERDLAASPTGEDGWWVYMSFVAEPVDWRGP